MADDSMTKRLGFDDVEKLICKVGEAHRSEIIQYSKTVQSMIQQHQAAQPSPQNSNGHESTSSKLNKASPLYFNMLTFSPDSAYSSSGGSVKSETLSPPKPASVAGPTLQQNLQPRLDMVGFFAHQVRS